MLQINLRLYAADIVSANITLIWIDRGVGISQGERRYADARLPCSNQSDRAAQQECSLLLSILRDGIGVASWRRLMRHMRNHSYFFNIPVISLFATQPFVPCFSVICHSQFRVKMLNAETRTMQPQIENQKYIQE